jgi:nucleoside recognition membrane protein YjiH
MRGLMSELNAWDSFYVIVGSAAGALIGLQFVVMTLIAEKPQLGVGEAASAFGTPTIVHFSCCLLIAALIRVPWPNLLTGALTGGVVGICGLIYMTITIWRMRRQSVYQLDLEDWTFHVLLPFLAYGALSVSSAAAISYTYGAMFGVGAATLLLLFIGIHNAWDAVAYQVLVVRRRDAEK